MLYDTTADVIRKALRGLNLAPAEAAAKAGLDEKEVLAASRGESGKETLERVARALGLSPHALASLPAYRPDVTLPEGVRQIEMPFDDETVNAWLIQADGHSLLFDAGESTGPIERILSEWGVSGVEVFITHSHHDHVGGLSLLGARAISSAGPQGTASTTLKPGDTLQRGPLKIRVIELPGHCEGAIGYAIEGLGSFVCVTGDSLFAGSMGGCAPGKAYQEGIRAIRENILSLPDEAALLPGHGPATSVGQERRHNAFTADE